MVGCEPRLQQASRLGLTGGIDKRFRDATNKGSIFLAHLKLEALTLNVDGPVDSWLAQAQQSQKGVLGDAAGDFFGIDMGL